jgi:excisionase family DNA binding protein
MPDEVSPLYVRLPRREADALDRAAFAGKVSKRELVTSALQRYLDDTKPKSELVLGRAEFRPAAAPEVLTVEQAAALLQVEPAEVEKLAKAGELPGRQIGGAWRFPRAALLEWLGG